MRELVTAEQVERLFLLLAIGLPLVGVIAGGLMGSRKGLTPRGALTGFAVGLLGPVNLILWRMYNHTTDALGMDTVRNLLVNLALFIALGCIVGGVAGSIARKRSVNDESKDV